MASKVKKVAFFIGAVWGTILFLRFVTSKVSVIPAQLKV